MITLFTLRKIHQIEKHLPFSKQKTGKDLALEESACRVNNPILRSLLLPLICSIGHTLLPLPFIYLGHLVRLTKYRKHEFVSRP